MCRHLAYIGKVKSLEQVLIKHKHSLLDMAFKPIEMENAKLNADGFGIGWVSKKKFFVYKNILPIWNDSNLEAITKNISSNFILANVRSATEANDLSFNNTHPFKYKDFIFSHNGFIKNFNDKCKQKIINYISSDLFSKIKGTTDSEYIFYLFIMIYKKANNIPRAIKETLKFLKQSCKEAMVNILLARNKNNQISIYATKYAINLNPPSLYYLKENDQNLLISSEKLDERIWISIKNNSLIEYRDQKLKILKL